MNLYGNIFMHVTSFFKFRVLFNSVLRLLLPLENTSWNPRGFHLDWWILGGKRKSKVCIDRIYIDFTWTNPRG